MGNEKYDEVVSLKDIISILKRYKFSIIFLTILITFIAYIYAYYQTNMYQVKATLQVETQKRTGSNDILKEALNGGVSSDLDTQIIILKSRFLVTKAMQRINLTTHIWGVDKFFKKEELYDNSPIKVEVLKGKNLKFKLVPFDNNSFTLELENGNSNHKHIYKYGKEIVNKDYKIIVTKTGNEFKDKYYEFVDYDPIVYANAIIGSSLKIKKVGDSSKVLEVSYMDTVPKRAKKFVNILIDEYIKQNAKFKSMDAEKSLEFINSQLSIISKKLKNSEKNIENFKTKEKTVNVSSNVDRISNLLSEIENKVAISNMKISMLKNIKKSIKLNRNLDTITLTGTGIEDESLTNTIKDLQNSILQRRILLKEFTPAHPKVQELTTKISNLKIIIKKSINNMLTSLQQKRALLVANMKKYQKSIQKLPKVQQNFLSLERKFSFNEKFYTYLLEKKTEAQIKKAASVNESRVIDQAILPSNHISPNRKKIIAIGFALGLFGSIILAFIRAYLDDTIKGKEDVLKATTVPVVATIPHYYKNKRDEDNIVVLAQPNSYISESFRILRTNIQFILKNNDNVGKVISVTSTVAAEGKTTISSNLGVILEMLGKKVIVINFDLRKPRLHKVFKLPNSKGLSEYLKGSANLNDIIKSTNQKDLDIISSGAVPLNPSELISSSRTDQLIDELKKIYDYIILDTPPVGIVTDARLLLSRSDLVLYVFKANYSKRDFIDIVNNLNNEEDVKKITVVVNDIKKEKEYGYQYGYYK